MNTFITKVWGILFVLLIGYSTCWTQNFFQSELQGISSFNPTSLQFGPDGRLYVSNLDGVIFIYTIERTAANTYTVTATEKITLVQEIPNYDDDGKRNFSITDRQVTGILVTGTGSNPILYVSSSDIRDGAGDKGDVNLDTNSGIISRLTFDGIKWDKVDLVRGIPRSEENHSNNGLHLSITEDTLFVPVAGMTNAGSPSNNFTFSSEYALSAAILSINLAALDTLPVNTDPFGQEYIYDLPTVDDPTRPGTEDNNDPFGGNDGLNQAKLVEGGPVQIYASGFRNAYDLEITSKGKMYTIDNGANGGWGGYPENEGPPTNGVSTVTNNYVEGEPGFINNLNGLHVISGPGYYGGHPNPIRANPSGAGLFTEIGAIQSFRTATSGDNPLPADWPPVPVTLANPIEGDFQQPGVDDASILTYDPSTNGICEYTASNFGGSLQGNLLAAGYDGSVFKAQFNETGDQVLNGQEILFSGFGTISLDITAQGDAQIFPGTIWVAEFSESKIFVFEPEDFEGGEVAFCAGEDEANVDEDGDGYTNADELDNGTNPCSSASKPSDQDGSEEGGFLVSDLNDLDDDDDGSPDNVDPFPLDVDNGLTTNWPLTREFFNNDPGTGFFGLGFTGLMTDGESDYLNLFDKRAIVAGGTSGLMTVPAPSGDAFVGPNTQENAFQFGLNVNDTQCPLFIRTRILAPLFGGNSAATNQSQGFYIGTGDQDNYIKLAIDGGIELLVENEGEGTVQNFSSPSILQATFIDLYLTINPQTGKVLASCKTNLSNETILVGDSITVEGPLLTAIQSTNQAIAVGLIATAIGTGNEFNATWDFIEIDAVPSSSSAQTEIQASTQSVIAASTTMADAFIFQNSSPDGQKIQSIELDFSTAFFSGLVIDASGNIGTDTGSGFVAGTGKDETGFEQETFSIPSQEGFQKIILNFSDFDQGEEFGFSLDIDPTQIINANDPTGNVSAISALELAGTTVKVIFEDCSEQLNYLAPSTDAENRVFSCLQESLPAAPVLEIQQISKAQDLVFNPNHIVNLIAEPNSEMLLWISEYDQPDPGLRQSNPYLGARLINQTSISITANEEGIAEVPIDLFYSDATAGINVIYAGVESNDCPGAISNVAVLKVVDVNCEYLRVNAGGIAFTASNATAYTNDSLFSESNIFSIEEGDDVGNTEDDLLYQTERWNSVFSYDIPVPANGVYTIRLHFAELFWTEPNQRVFDVSIEGIDVLRGFDIFAEVGIKQALVKEFNIPVQDQELNIIFNSLIDNAKISAIEVLTPCDLLVTSTEPSFSARERSIIVYPNPTENKSFNIDLDDFVLGTKASIRVRDLAGRLIYTHQERISQPSESVEIKLPIAITSGLYFLQIQVQSDLFTRQIWVK